MFFSSDSGSVLTVSHVKPYYTYCQEQLVITNFLLTTDYQELATDKSHTVQPVSTICRQYMKSSNWRNDLRHCVKTQKLITFLRKLNTPSPEGTWDVGVQVTVTICNQDINARVHTVFSMYHVKPFAWKQHKEVKCATLWDYQSCVRSSTTPVQWFLFNHMLKTESSNLLVMIQWPTPISDDDAPSDTI